MNTRGGAQFFVPDVKLLDLPKTASELGFQIFFCWNFCGYGCNLKSLRHMKRYFQIQIQKALDIIFPKHLLDHWFKNKFSEVQFQKKCFWQCEKHTAKLTKHLQNIYNIYKTFSLKIYFQISHPGSVLER